MSVNVCDREASIKRRPWHTGGCCAMVKQNPLRRFTKRPKHNPLDVHQEMFSALKLQGLEADHPSARCTIIRISGALNPVRLNF